jgi:small basic protein
VIPFAGLILGIVAGIMFDVSIPIELQPYLPIAIVAALDAVFGGLRAVMEGLFDDKVFVVSFVANVMVASFIVFLGDQLGVGAQLSTAVIVVLGIRIFTNVATIRRLVFRA